MSKNADCSDHMKYLKSQSLAVGSHSTQFLLVVRPSLLYAACLRKLWLILSRQNIENYKKQCFVIAFAVIYIKSLNISDRTYARMRIYTRAMQREEDEKEKKKIVPYMENKSPSNWLCLQPNFPWHALNSECKAACVWEWASESERASMRVWASICSRQSVQNVPGLTGSWQCGYSALNGSEHTPSASSLWKDFSQAKSPGASCLV